METVFVVLGECGEYSDRSVWVSGVYKTKDEAQAAMLDRMARRREYDQWSERKNRNWPRLPLDYFKFPLNAEQEAEHTAMTLAAETAAGPKPEYERAERVELFEMPVGVWQTEYLDEIASAEPVP